MKCGWFISALAVVTAFVAACTIDPPLQLRQTAEVVVKLMWKIEVYPEGVKPGGVTFYFFRDGEYVQQYTTAQVDSCVVNLSPGRYRVYMISQSPEEYGTMEFSDMTDFDKARVSVVETKSRWYTRAEGEILINNPELMTAGVSDEFEVSEDMIEEIYRRVHDAKMNGTDSGVLTYTIRVPVHPQSIVSRYWVTIYSSNADVLKAVRSSTSGMARTWMLTKDRTGDEEGTQLITDWKLTMDDSDTRIGHLDGYVTTFGFPRGELPSPDRDPRLNVSTLLVDNETVEDYVFLVGDKIVLEEPIPQGHRLLYHLVLGSIHEPAITPKDVQPPEGEQLGGFDAMVEEWEDGASLDIEM
ncbi:MAG: DUF5119 domain-containing protein [Bacteroidales bacterium]|nr:DUF5119 domain-containing protein [Bacteroidales bacterium]